MSRYGPGSRVQKTCVRKPVMLVFHKKTIRATKEYPCCTLIVKALLALDHVRLPVVQYQHVVQCDINRNMFGFWK